MKRLAALLLVLPALLPASPVASEGLVRDPALAACAHLKGALRKLHRALRDDSGTGQAAVQQALLELYQTDRRLGCSFAAAPDPGASAT